MNVPVNKWTVMTVIALLSIFGGDLVEPILRAVAVMSASHVPAL